MPATLEETIETARTGNPSVISAQYTEKASRDTVEVVDDQGLRRAAEIRKVVFPHGE